MPYPFAETLTQYRKDAGFKTAYAFFHANGGKDLFKVSYRMYLQYEDGHRLPRFDMMGAYFFALRLTQRSAPAAEFICAWLKSSLGSDNYRAFLEPLISIPAETVSGPLHKAIQVSLSEKKVYVSPEQLEAIGKDKNTHLCWILLSNDKGIWTPVQFAKYAGITEGEAVSAMKTLTSAGILKRKANGGCLCPMAGAMVEFPHGTTYLGLFNRMSELREQLLSSGNVVYKRRGLLRASLGRLANVAPLLSLNVSTAQSYAVYEKQKDTALFAVECSIVKVLDF